MGQEPPEETTGGAGGGLVGGCAGEPRPWLGRAAPWPAWAVPGAWLPGACAEPVVGVLGAPAPGACDEPPPGVWAGVAVCAPGGRACPGMVPANAMPSTAEAPVALAATPSVIARVRPITRLRCSAARDGSDVP